MGFHADAIHPRISRLTLTHPEKLPVLKHEIRQSLKVKYNKGFFRTRRRSYNTEAPCLHPLNLNLAKSPSEGSYVPQQHCHSKCPEMEKKVAGLTDHISGLFARRVLEEAEAGHRGLPLPRLSADSQKLFVSIQSG